MRRVRALAVTLVLALTATFLASVRKGEGSRTVDVLVATHHGARHANSTARHTDWYRIVTPRALLIAANGRQHPYAEVLSRARAQGIPVYCTHTNGSVAARATRDGAFVVRADRTDDCSPGAELPQ